MRVNNIQNNTPSFNGFYVNARGAKVLAEKFVKCPEQEERFMASIVKTLENSVCDVFYDGYRATVKGPHDTKPLIVVAPNTTLDQSNLGTVIENSSQIIYRRQAHVAPTRMFEEISPLNEIETAKNIAVDKAYEECSKAIKKYSNETVEEKAQRLMKRFNAEV